MKVLVVGSVTRDTIIETDASGGDRVAESPGGTAFYASIAYARLGAAVSIATRIAPDDESWVRAALPVSVEVHSRPSATTTQFENRYTRERRSQRVSAIADPIGFEPDLLRDVDWVHLGPLHPLDLDRAWYRASRAPLALDLQGLVRHVDAQRVVSRAVPGLQTLLTDVRWLKADHDEWRVALDALGIDEATFVRRHPHLEIVRTAGRDGGAVLRDALSYEWPPLPLVERSDATGAGDVFFATYLYHRIERGQSEPEAAFAAARYVSRFLLEKHR